MLSFRPAALADRPAVVEICSRIWDGDDYVPAVFDDWLAQPEGQFTAAELDGKVVGVAKLTRLGRQDYWLEGIRVHADFRGRGLAAGLHDYHLDLWRRRGRPGALRLLTLTDNQAIVKLCERTGFASIFQVTFAVAEAQAGAQRFTPLTSEDGDRAFEYILRAPLYADTRGLCDISWRFRSLTRGFLAERIGAGAAYRWGGWEGVLLVADGAWEAGPATLVVQFPAVGAERRPAFFADLRGLAAALGKSKVSWMLPHRPELLAELAPAGYSQPWPEVFHCFEIRQG